MAHFPKILLIGDSDSQLLACESLALVFLSRGFDVTVNAVPRMGTPNEILERIRRAVELWQLPIIELVRSSAITSFSAIGVFLVGSKLVEVRKKIEMLSYSYKPLLFCGFNGIVLEGFEEAITWRLGYDLICLNGPRDKSSYDRLIADTPFQCQKVVVHSLCRRTIDVNELDCLENRPKTLVFAEQVAMPSKQIDRHRMMMILAGLAQRSPDWQIVLKPRIAPGERTFHSVKQHISTTYRESSAFIPENFVLDYSPLPELLAKARILATVSSTAFFDALDYGVKPLIMLDLGILDCSGTHTFIGSDVCKVLDEYSDIDQLEAQLTWPNKLWLDWVGYRKDNTDSNLIEEISQWSKDPNKESHLNLDHPGYTVNSKRLSFNDLRRNAERAISKGNIAEAEAWLELAQHIRPDHRNLARRLSALRHENGILRKLAIALTPKFKG